MDYVKYDNNGNLEKLKELSRIERVDGVWVRIEKTLPEILAEGYKPYVANQEPEYNSETQYIGTEIKEFSDRFETIYTIYDYTEQELAENEAEKAAERKAYISGLSMTKAEFLILVTGLTKNMPQPVTLEAIEALLASNSDIRMRFTYANSVERNHPMLDGVSAMFGVAPELLDTMFEQKDELIYMIDNNIPIEGL